jgi:hypothetical protein
MKYGYLGNLHIEHEHGAFNDACHILRRQGTAWKEIVLALLKASKDLRIKRLTKN